MSSEKKTELDASGARQRLEAARTATPLTERASQLATLGVELSQYLRALVTRREQLIVILRRDHHWPDPVIYSTLGVHNDRISTAVARQGTAKLDPLTAEEAAAEGVAVQKRIAELRPVQREAIAARNAVVPQLAAAGLSQADAWRALNRVITFQRVQQLWPLDLRPRTPQRSSQSA